jgi:hypothetical protein
MAKNNKREEAYFRIMTSGKKEGVRPKLGSSEVWMVLHGEEDKKNLLQLLQEIELEYPIDVTIKRATSNRTLAQNRTQWQWFKDAGKQGDHTATEYRAYCKLHFGVPILRRDSVKYRQRYDEIVRPLSYEHKLGLMVEPFDFPVTSAMNVAQHSEFLDECAKFFQEQGIKLTTPTGWDTHGEN